MTNSMIDQQLGKYRIQSLLAQGGMAEVYLAYEEQLQRQVVVKVMLPHLVTNQEFVARFEREALTTARLNHANIIPVYGTGVTEDGRPYLVMQYVRGGTLRDRIRKLVRREELFTTVTALMLVRYIAEALRVAHEAGIVHRDLKPSNILLHPNGLPVITDLGIAGLEAASGLTRTGALIGTPHYMSPEQADGRPADARSDIYALGIILYELLAGNVPFRGERLEAVVYQHLNEPPPSLGRVRPDLSAHTIELAYRCLKKNPDDRYQTAAELLAALDQALAAEGDSQPGAMTDTGRQALFGNFLRRSQVLRTLTSIRERSRLPLWFFGLLLGALVVVGVLLWPRSPETTGGVLPTGVATRVAEVTFVPSPTAAEPVIINSTSTSAPPLPTATVTFTPAPTETPTMTPDATLLTAVAPIDRIIFQSNRDGDLEIFSMLPDGSNQIQLTDNEFVDEFPAASPNGTQILFQSDREGDLNIYVMDRDGRNQRPLTNIAGDERHPTWSPNGSQIAYLSDQNGVANIYIANADGRNPRQVTNSDVNLGNMSWSPDNRLVYNVPRGDIAGQEIYSIDLNGQNRLRLTDNVVADWSAEHSADGRFIVYLHPQESRYPAIYVMNADGTGQREIYSSSNNEYDWAPHWSADGQYIYFTKGINGVSYLYRIRLDGTDETLLTARGEYPSWASGTTTAPEPVTIEPDGERIAYQCGGDRDARIFLYNPETETQDELPNQPRNSRVPAFSADGTEISYRSDVNGTWQIYAGGIDGRFQRQLTAIIPDVNDSEVSWSPDGLHLVIVSDQTGAQQLFLITNEGGDRQRLTFANSATFDDPSWSSRNQIAFESNMNGRYQIFLVSPQGGTPQEVIGLSDGSTTPAWSPDGERLAFEVRTGSEYQIWIANRNGTNPEPITTAGSTNLRPAWSPDGRQLAFHSNAEQTRPDRFDIWTIDLETKALTQITARGDCTNPAWGNVALRR